MSVYVEHQTRCKATSCVKVITDGGHFTDGQGPFCCSACINPPFEHLCKCPTTLDIQIAKMKKAGLMQDPPTPDNQFLPGGIVSRQGIKIDGRKAQDLPTVDASKPLLRGEMNISTGEAHEFLKSFWKAWGGRQFPEPQVRASLEHILHELITVEVE